jgi:hypothetical protein
MKLTDDEERREYELKVLQMETNIRKLDSDLRYESRKFAVQLVVGAAALLGAGAAAGNYLAHHEPPAPPPAPPQVIVVQVPTAPAAHP